LSPSFSTSRPFGLALVILDAAAITWFAFGAPPMGNDLWQSGSDYSVNPGIPFLLMAVGAIVGLIGVVLAISPGRELDRWDR
jgi:hypothetical protein